MFHSFDLSCQNATFTNTFFTLTGRHFQILVLLRAYVASWADLQAFYIGAFAPLHQRCGPSLIRMLGKSFATSRFAGCPIQVQPLRQPGVYPKEYKPVHPSCQCLRPQQQQQQQGPPAWTAGSLGPDLGFGFHAEKVLTLANRFATAACACCLHYEYIALTHSF